jgi:hypothetical protein
MFSLNGPIDIGHRLIEAASGCRFGVTDGPGPHWLRTLVPSNRHRPATLVAVPQHQKTRSSHDPVNSVSLPCPPRRSPMPQPAPVYRVGRLRRSSTPRRVQPKRQSSSRTSLLQTEGLRAILAPVAVISRGKRKGLFSSPTHRFDSEPFDLGWPPEISIAINISQSDVGRLDGRGTPCSRADAAVASLVAFSQSDNSRNFALEISRCNSVQKVY